jgi:Putative phage serine protease XkdF
LAKEAVIKVKVSLEEPDEKTEPWDGSGLAGVVVKAEDERRFTLVMGYPANSPDVAVARDGFQDFAKEGDVEEAAWNYLTKSQQVGLWHKDGTDGAGQVVESYIYRGPDWAIKAADDSEQVIRSGDWLVGIRWNEDTWPLVKEGKVGGVSMQGKTKRRSPSPADLAHLRKRA